MLTPATPPTTGAAGAPGAAVSAEMTLIESAVLSPEEIGVTAIGPGLGDGKLPEGGEAAGKLPDGGEAAGKLSLVASDEMTVMESSPTIVCLPLCLLNRL